MAKADPFVLHRQFLGLSPRASVADVFYASAEYWYGATTRERCERQARAYYDCRTIPAFMIKVTMRATLETFAPFVKAS